jgi:hypothetical protein
MKGEMTGPLSRRRQVLRRSALPHKPGGVIHYALRGAKPFSIGEAGKECGIMHNPIRDGTGRMKGNERREKDRGANK